MIASLKGILQYKSTNEIIIDCGGVGYQAFVSLNTSSVLPQVGESVFVFSLMVPREDEILLFGFAEKAEKDAFKLLTSVSGIGPRTAVSILSSMTVCDLQEYIISGNITQLQKIPGIGKKTAERVHLELRDKISQIKVDGKVISDTALSSIVKQEAISALIALGYSSALAEKAIKKVIELRNVDKITAEELIKNALKVAMNL